MKTTKKFRLLAIVLALLLAFGAMPALAVEIDSGDYATWAQNAVEDMYERLMAAETYGAYTSIAETLSDTAYTAFLDRLTDEQRAALEERLEGLGSADMPEGEAPEYWESSSLAGAVSFTKVAPLMEFDYGISTLELLSNDISLLADGNSSNGVELNKTAKVNSDGSYTITLEAYATGEQTTVSRIDPVDIVLVLDTSGSMKYPMDDSGYEKVYGKVGSATWWSGNVEYTNSDGLGNYAKNAYSVTGFDSTNYDSCYRTYFVIENGKYVPVWYYKDFGWATKSKNFENNELNRSSTPQKPVIDNGTDQSGRTQFYKINPNTTSLYALQQAANQFIDNVLTTSAASQIAIVNFGSVANEAHEFSSDKASLQAAVNNLTVDGATQADLGMKGAYNLLAADSIKDDGRKKVVVMFTDGVPTTNNDFEGSVADGAIKASYDITTAYGATIYTIGVFAGANGSLDSFNTDNVNKYMHLVSSNYPGAQSMTDPGDVNDQLNGKSYYLSAASADDLMNIFVKISEEVGGATNTTLGSNTVIEDIIAPQFTVPAGASDIKLYTADCTDKKEGVLQFEEPTSATGVTASINTESDAVTVTGFDFSKNWCGDHSGTYSGKKLIIEFTVSLKEGFLGGNDVYTNAEATLSNGTASYEFPRPTVNVPIKDVTVTAEDKNVYLLGDLLAKDIKSGATIKCDTVDLKYDEPNFGLEAWQNAYADVTIEYVDASGNAVTDLNALKDDVTYTITATVAPKTPADSAVSTQGKKAETKTDSATQNINVFKPELTFKDNTVDYMSAIDGTKYVRNKADAFYATGNYASTDWKHDGTSSTDVTMTGTAPTLNLAYNPTGGVTDGKVTSTDYVPVQVTVQINTTDITANTTFAHENCTVEGCKWDTAGSTTGNPAFLLHVINKFADLTITKVANGVEADPGQSFLFQIIGPDGYKNEVIIVGNDSVTIKDLPIGEYTVTEDTNWSWRYKLDSVSLENGKITLAANAKNEVKFTNTRTEDQWLDGNTNVDNVFKSSGIEKNPAAATN